ncbi:MAG: lysophospholipid acyltransferase family protein, partial [Planctomycetota bacterium]
QRRYPWHFRLLTYVVTGLGSMLVWCWFKTLRVRVIGPEPDIADHVIYATWHRGILYAVFHWRWRNGVLMASASKDGEWAAGMIKRFGNRVVRGSSSRGGRVALQGLSEAMLKGASGGLLPDAPRGPARKCKPGILALAQRTGLPIIPTQFAAERCFRLRSWDRTLLPWPVSRFVVGYGEPFYVEKSLEGASFDRRLAELDSALNDLADDVDGFFRHRPAPKGGHVSRVGTSAGGE